MNISQSWKEFAGGRAELVLRENLKGVEADLLLQLEKTRSLFHHTPKITELLKRPTSVNPERDIQWAESRRALVKVLNLLENSKSQISISHTKFYSLVIGVCDSRQVMGIGVDIESSDRIVSPAAAAKYTVDSEHYFDVSGLELWVVKEACYKADAMRRADLVSKYCVREFDRSSGEGLVSLIEDASPFIRFKLQNCGDHLVAFAIATGCRIDHLYEKYLEGEIKCLQETCY